MNTSQTSQPRTTPTPPRRDQTELEREHREAAEKDRNAGLVNAGAREDQRQADRQRRRKDLQTQQAKAYQQKRRASRSPTEGELDGMRDTLDQIMGSHTARGGAAKRLAAGGDTSTTIRELAKIVRAMAFGVGPTSDELEALEAAATKAYSDEELDAIAEEQAREHRDSKVSLGRDQRSQHDRAREDQGAIPATPPEVANR